MGATGRTESGPRRRNGASLRGVRSGADAVLDVADFAQRRPGVGTFTCLLELFQWGSAGMQRPPIGGAPPGHGFAHCPVTTSAT